MKSALSHNEIEILDHQVATLSYQLSEIAGLLESRLGDEQRAGHFGAQRPAGIRPIRTTRAPQGGVAGPSPASIRKPRD